MTDANSKLQSALKRVEYLCDSKDKEIKTELESMRGASASKSILGRVPALLMVLAELCQRKKVEMVDACIELISRLAENDVLRGETSTEDGNATLPIRRALDLIYTIVGIAKPNTQLLVLRAYTDVMTSGYSVVHVNAFAQIFVHISQIYIDPCTPEIRESSLTTLQHLCLQFFQKINPIQDQINQMTPNANFNYALPSTSLSIQNKDDMISSAQNRTQSMTDCERLFKLLIQLSLLDPGRINPFNLLANNESTLSSNTVQQQQLITNSQQSTYSLSIVLNQDEKDKQIPQDLIQTTLKYRTMALHILMMIIIRHGQFISKNQNLSRIAQFELIPAILGNAGLPNIDIFRYSAALFSAILKEFRLQFYRETESLFILFMRVIEQQDTQIPEKITLLYLLRQSLFSDGQLLCDIFLNYDCRIDAASIFETLISSISNLAIQYSNYQTLSPSSSSSNYIVIYKQNNNNIKIYIDQDDQDSIIVKLNDQSSSANANKDKVNIQQQQTNAQQLKASALAKQKLMFQKQSNESNQFPQQIDDHQRIKTLALSCLASFIQALSSFCSQSQQYVPSNIQQIVNEQDRQKNKNQQKQLKQIQLQLYSSQSQEVLKPVRFDDGGNILTSQYFDNEEFMNEQGKGKQKDLQIQATKYQQQQNQLQ